MSGYIKLEPSLILNVPLTIYEKDFTFIVNGKSFVTSHFIADLLSPSVSKARSKDPSLRKYDINTKTEGDFQQILDLVSFKEKYIATSNRDFFFEVLEQLGVQKKDFAYTYDEITIENVIDLIKLHENNEIYRDIYTKEVDFLSSHFYYLIHDQKDKILTLSKNTLENIFTNNQFKVSNENDLILLINELYLKDKKFSTLYEYVYFENVTSKIMNKFIEIFDDKYMTHNIWQSMSKRLKRDIIIRRYKNDENKWIPRYQVFDGIIKYMKNSSKNIKNEIDITYSSDYYEKTNPYVLFDYESEGYFCTKNEPNSWICFEFKNHKIIPTHYTIRSTSGGKGGYHLMSWVIEGSLDKNNWEILSEERNNPVLDDSFAVYTFQIQSKSQHQIKFIRIRSTGLDSNSSNYLYISAFEINGKLI